MYFGAFHILPLSCFLTPSVTCVSVALSYTHTQHTGKHSNTQTQTHTCLWALLSNFAPHTAKHHSTQSRMHIKMAALYYQHQRCTRMLETVLICHMLLPLPRCTAPPPHLFHFLSASAMPTASIMTVLPSFLQLFHYFLPIFSPFLTCSMFICIHPFLSLSPFIWLQRDTKGN